MFQTHIRRCKCFSFYFRRTLLYNSMCTDTFWNRLPLFQQSFTSLCITACTFPLSPLVQVSFWNLQKSLRIPILLIYICSFSCPMFDQGTILNISKNTRYNTEAMHLQSFFKRRSAYACKQCFMEWTANWEVLILGPLGDILMAF